MSIGSFRISKVTKWASQCSLRGPFLLALKALGPVVDLCERRDLLCCVDTRLSGLLGGVDLGVAQGFAVGGLQTPKVPACVCAKDFKHVDGPPWAGK